MQITIQNIESAAAEYAGARARLSDLIQALTETIEDAKRKATRSIKAAVRAAADKESELKQLLWSSPELFAKPKTLTFHGIKVGYRKGTGSVTYDDEDTVIALIEKRLKDQADVLIKTTKALRKKPLEALDVKVLKMIGCEVEATGEQVVCKPVDSEVEKAVKALLKGALEEAEGEGA